MRTLHYAGSLAQIIAGFMLLIIVALSLGAFAYGIVAADGVPTFLPATPIDTLPHPGLIVPELLIVIFIGWTLERATPSDTTGSDATSPPRDNRARATLIVVTPLVSRSAATTCVRCVWTKPATSPRYASARNSATRPFPRRDATSQRSCICSSHATITSCPDRTTKRC
jgi:hypothetical protein